MQDLQAQGLQATANDTTCGSSAPRQRGSKEHHAHMQIMPSRAQLALFPGHYWPVAPQACTYKDTGRDIIPLHLPEVNIFDSTKELPSQSAILKAVHH